MGLSRRFCTVRCPLRLPCRAELLGAICGVLLFDDHRASSSHGRRDRYGSRAQCIARAWGQLLEAGVQIAEYQPTMLHCKVLVLDGLWVSVGSTNFDNRSLRLN